jgi:hypothetical protein
LDESDEEEHPVQSDPPGRYAMGQLFERFLIPAFVLLIDDGAMPRLNG